MTTHSAPGSVAITQQLVANIGAAKESINIARLSLFHAQIKAQLTLTPWDRVPFAQQYTFHPRSEAEKLLSIAPTT
jgi:hypothetical protein